MVKILHSKCLDKLTSVIGGKAKGLLLLQQNNFITPNFFVLNFYSLSKIVDDGISIEIVLRDWIKENRILPNSLWAVRSSAESEDGIVQSFAGVFTSVLNVSLQNMAEAIQTVKESYSKLLKQGFETDKNSTYGIIIQEMIRSEFSGVAFSHNPQNTSDESIQISVIPGIGENLVSGKEDGFMITHANGKTNYLTTEAVFNGQAYSDHLYSIEKTNEEIKTEISKYIPLLIKGIEKLNRICGFPIDVEFTIAENTLYWLQVRAITTGKEEIIVWDNTAAEGNYPGIMLPLSISLISNSFYLGYKGLAKFLGMPSEVMQKNNYLLVSLTGEIDGVIYYNINSWQKLLFQLPFGNKLSTALPNIWGMEKVYFRPVNHGMNAFIKAKIFFKLFGSLFFIHNIKKKYVVHYNRVQQNFESKNYDVMDHEEIIKAYKNLELQLTEKWQAPVLNNLLTVIFMLVSKKIIANSRLNLKYPNFTNNGLFSQGEVISVTILRSLQSIIKNIVENTACLQLFKVNEPDKIYFQLQQINKVLFDKIIVHIKNYGERSEAPELKMETINFKEDPILFFSYLKNNLDLKTNSNVTPFNYAQILKKEYRYNFFKRVFIRGIMKYTIARIIDRENFRFMRTKTYGLVRKIFQATDRVLVKNGLIEEKNDSLYLKLNELTAIHLSGDYKEIIKTRKDLYTKYESQQHSTRYHETGKKLTAVQPEEFNVNDLIFKGIGCSGGIVEGEVKTIHNNVNDVGGYKDKILIANYFEPGKLGLFSKAAGLISARGNLLSHTSILCREMGIPFIPGAKGLFNRVKDGDIIKMNGAIGKIEIIKKHD